MHKRIFIFIFILNFLSFSSDAKFRILETGFDSNKNSISDIYVMDGYGCTGSNESPNIKWSDPPLDTKSYAITIYDLDADTGSGWWHWVAYDILPELSNLPSGSGNTKSYDLKNNIGHQTFNDYGLLGYGGPCPPQNDRRHKYVVSVHALDVKSLPLPNKYVSSAIIRLYINMHSIAMDSKSFYCCDN